MRVALVSLIAAAALAPSASAQVSEPSATQSPSSPMAMPMPAPLPPPGRMPPPSSPPPAPAAPATAPAAPATAPAAAPPEGPPPAPTDPAAIALLSTLDTVCVPAVDGGNLGKLAKAAGYRNSGENFVLKRPNFQLTILAQGSNPDQCHVDVIHPVDPEAPAKPIVVALHDWAVATRGWSLYRNDKSVVGSQEITTRSWEHDAGPKHEALVITTFRKADGTPSQRLADTSAVIYSAIKSPG